MFEGYEELNTQDVEWMQEVIRTLLAQTFLPERKIRTYDAGPHV